MDQKELIAGCIRGDRDCQMELFTQYSGKLLAVCARYTRHRMEAEDMVQDAFIKIFKNLEKFEGKGSFEGWMRRIAINTALKNYNKNSFKKEKIGLHDYQDNAIDPEVVAALHTEELMKVVSGLPDGYRVVFNLYVVEGFSHREIAERLEIKESTSRSQLVKARKMLQSRITQIMRILV
ncbi:MAG TPA: sigma-70 family RNA polymerase sigma factor [Phaeodactylibacter sp.]|nr:sigma-70 family RNA polymerase sigma factor [Phaeodactylibacter sp.]